MMKQYMAAIEALLFASGEPLDINKIAKTIDLNIADTKKLLLSLQASYEERDGGICILRLDDKFQMTTQSRYADKVRKLLEINRNMPLSSASLEVLALISYNQPVTKAFVEQVRGVDCSGVISSLIQKGLIEEKGRLELPGKPLLYGTTTHFLRCFCLTSLDDLPPLPHKREDDAEDETDGEEESISFDGENEGTV